MSASTISTAVAGLRFSFDQGFTRTEEWRRSQLERMRDMLTEREADFEAALQADLGKAPIESQITEIGFLLSEIEHTLSHLSKWMRPRRVAAPLVATTAAGGEKVEIRVGPGADVLPTLEDAAPFDLVFIDADKESNTIYLDWAARLGRPGALVIVDNVVRGGRIADAGDDSAQVAGVRAGLAMLRDDPRFDATALQTLDAKGWDGIAIALVTDAAARPASDGGSGR